MSYFIRMPDGKQWCDEISHSVVSARELKQVISCNLSVDDEDTYMHQNGKIISEDAVVELIPGSTIHVFPRMFGGKGGFGSMLRAIGAQIEKTTNREACRDLSGRRMRDVNDEKKVTEWVAKQADREREEARKRAERVERRRADPRHVFDDKGYTENIRQNAERIGEALQHGLKTAGAVSSSSNGKRKLDEPSTSSGKRGCMWLGMDNEDIEEDSDEDERDKVHLEASPCQRPSSSTCSKPPSASLSSLPHTLSDPSSASCSSRSDTPNHQDTLPDSSTTDASSKQPTSSTQSEDEPDPPDASGADSSMLVADVAEISASDEYRVSDTHHTSQEGESHCSSNTTQDSTQNKSGAVDLDDFNTAEELEGLGLDRLKVALTSLGLKCGGTLQQRAQRLFSVKGLTLDQIDPQLFSTSQKKNGKKKHK